MAIPASVASATTAPTLPATTGLDALAPATLMPTVSSMRANSRSGEMGQPCVLIVIYNTTERLLLKQMVQMEGYAVHTFETGLEALRVVAANEGTYTLGLIGAVLPDIDPHILCSQMLELVCGGVGYELHMCL